MMPGRFSILSAVPCRRTRGGSVHSPDERVEALQDVRLLMADMRPAAGVRDFDFLHGQWLVDNRRLPEPIDRARGWIRFDAVHECRVLLGGLGHVEEISGDDDVSSATLRFFEPAVRRWTARAVSSRDGAVQSPLAGGFEGCRGVLIGEHRSREHEPMLIRETWDTCRPDRPRCERACSEDGGATWHTHWIMDFTRVDWPG